MPIAAIGNFNRDIRLFDYLNTFRFHVMDVSFAQPPVFSLTYGFASCTAPEISVETKDFKEGSFEYRKSVIMGASVGEIEFTQGARLFNSDFYDWINSAIVGNEPVRRNLLVIQYSDLDAKLVGTGASVALGALVGAEQGGIIGAIAGGISGGLSAGFQQLSDVIVRPPARAWLLANCIPTRYKASNDFNALSEDISVMELAVKPESFTEINTGIGA